MDLGLQGKTAVITGGSKGIGFAIAEELAREGVDLHLATRSARDLKQAATDVECRFGVRATIHPVDLSDRNIRDAFARECTHVDILVNCAGAIPGGALEQVSEDAWRTAWDLKLFGYIGITRIIYEECAGGAAVSSSTLSALAASRPTPVISSAGRTMRL
ncbi:MAG TPA: SDR family NAD(P)-dependent oxidoreductase [Mesorhizobium sp.]|nr:SDR family NAD(P)-dependent oxidoreductase [Mesorhizobium sp.]